MEGSERRKLAGDRLKKVRPKTVSLTDESLIHTQTLPGGDPLPLLVSPAVEGVQLIEWARDHRDFVESQLLDSGGLLLRGFGLRALGELDTFVRVFSPELMEYRERSAPRTQLEGRIYTSTEYPKHQHIAFHNEFSYALSWPLKICFFCVKAAARGGETPIADSRKVYRLLSPALRAEFEAKGVMYVRNYGGGMDLPWQEVFQTEDRSAVEEYCRSAPMDFEWRDGDRLRTRSVRPAVAVHPVTGQTVWFNQAHLFHVSNLEPSVRETMEASFAEEDLPRNTFFGDGSRIAPEALDEIRGVYDQVAVAFPWQEGDVLLLENMLIAHGRNPFEGDRTIAVAMADPYRRED